MSRRSRPGTVTMDGGHPIKVATVPPTEPAGQPSAPTTMTFMPHVEVTRWSVGWNNAGERWTAPVRGVYDVSTWPPRLIKEIPMADPIEAAEHFTQEAVDRAVRIATEAKKRMRAEQLERVRQRFSHHPPTHPVVVEAHERARALGEMFSIWLLDLPECPEKDQALFSVDSATMWANAAIARTQLGITPENAPDVDTPEK
jgi:hypothetical protein